MSRPAKPDSVKRASGTLQPCRSAVQSRRLSRSVSGMSLSPEPPVGLTKEAREAWTNAIENSPKGLLKATDLSVVERWARTYALYRKVAKQIDHEGVEVAQEGKDGAVNTVPNPLIATLVRLGGVLIACEKELGFTPGSRARVNAAEPEEETNSFDDFS